MDGPAVLEEDRTNIFGLGFVVIIQEQFEAVYGCAPYTSVDRMIDLLPDRHDNASLEN